MSLAEASNAGDASEEALVATRAQMLIMDRKILLFSNGQLERLIVLVIKGQVPHQKSEATEITPESSRENVGN